MASSRAPKQWCLTKKETINSFENWRQNLIYTLSLDTNFSVFLSGDLRWEKKTRSIPLRGFVDDADDVPQDRRRTAHQKMTHLELMLGQIANFCPVISRTAIVKQSTSVDGIWQSIRMHYGFQSTGAHFLDFSEIHFEHDESPEDLFQRLSAFVDDNLLQHHGGISHHDVLPDSDEELSPTLENFIVLTWLQLIHKDLPRLVKQRYGTELRSHTLASIKPEISLAMSSLLNEIHASDDAKVLRTAASSFVTGSPNENICIDYTQLQTKYDEEFVCKDRAEKYASQLHSQTAAIKRESNILMMQVGPDEKLMKALVDIEEISEEKTELQQEYETKIEELEEKVKELSDQTQLDELQKENENMMETNSLLPSRIEKLDVQYQEIQEKYKELEKKYDDATRPPPPPPPPPLPPALHGQIKGGFMRRQSKKNKQKVIQAGVSMNAGYQSAMDEMMKRIHEGPRLNRTLKPVKKRLEIQDDIDCSAGEDFQKYLPRRHASEGNVMSPLNGNDSPFAVKLRNRRPVGSTSFDEEGAFLNNKVKKEGIEEENLQNANANTESQPTSLIQDSTDKKSSTDEENSPISPKTVPNDITASTSETDKTNVKSQTLSLENLTLPLDSSDAEKSLTDGSLTSKTATSPTGSLKMSSTTAPLKSRPSVTAKPPNLVSSPTSPTQKTSVMNRTSQSIPVSPTTTETGSTTSTSPPWNVKLRPTPTPNIKQGISSMEKDGQEEVKLPRKGTVLAMRKQFSQ